MKQLTALAITLTLLTACTKNSPFPPNINQTPVRGLFNLYVDDKQPNTSSFMSKGDSTTQGGWFFDDNHFRDTTPHTDTFTFYVTRTPEDDGDKTGLMLLATNLDGMHLADSVVDHNTVVSYTYRGTGTWHLHSQTGTLQHYFKSQASGTLTYEYKEFGKDERGEPYDPPSYHATLDGTGD